MCGGGELGAIGSVRVRVAVRVRFMDRVWFRLNVRVSSSVSV